MTAAARPGDIVHDHKKRPAEQHGRRDEALIIMPEKHPRKVRDDKADPPDHTAHGNAGGRDERSAHNDHKTEPRRMHAETARFLLAEREQVDAPAQQKERHHADERRDESKLQIARFGRRERAHQPVCDGRELLFGVCNELYKRCARREQRADNDAGKHHGKCSVHAACPADAPRERHRAHAADERAHRHAEIVERQKNAERRAEARAVGCAENVRRYHRVSEHALICRTRNGKPRADQRRERHARQTDVQYDRLFLAGIQFPRHFRAEELAHPLAQHVPQNAEKRSLQGT